MASQKCVLIGLLIFFVAFIIIGVIILVSFSVFATSDQKQIITYYSTSEKSTIATLKSPVTSTFDNMKSSTTSLTTQANLNATSVESSPKSDNSTIKPNDNFIKGIYIRFVSIQHLITCSKFSSFFRKQLQYMSTYTIYNCRKQICNPMANQVRGLDC